MSEHTDLTLENPRTGEEEHFGDLRDYSVSDDGVITVEFHRPGHDADVTIEETFRLDWRVKSIDTAVRL